MTKKVITQTNTNEEVIKKSLFIGVCAHIECPQDFQSFLEQHQDLNATHNCWAYRVGDEYRFNDDGEPSGTAGKPILAAIEGAGFDYTAALVIRHYGGIKLGTGGLARAYGGTIAKNLQNAAHKTFVPTTSLQVEVPFESSQLLFKYVAEFNAKVSTQKFNESGLVAVIELAVIELNKFRVTLTDASKGQARFIGVE
ncbi:IMPACT family protein [Marinicella sp. S1101]|uniref:IMPACT family protein n=1 Tax=Marinicella marina TaxID=2996016 RepID=UPI002260F6A2|nr:YigZ family protein [Marinicella marina]MCX7553547.1 IMPACT family protein [Marinicella marina]MDJ1140171.1 YigZ family protein [Marinicella marina]